MRSLLIDNFSCTLIFDYTAVSENLKVKTPCYPTTSDDEGAIFVG